MSLAFVFCLERGALESQALLLCRSIRRYAGRYRGASIHTFQPRPGREIGRETRRQLGELGAVHHDEALNTEFSGYPYGNKVFACARAEEILPEDLLVFLDTDTLILGEPADLDLPPGIDFAALPVSRSRLASTGPGDANEPYWRRIHEVCGVEGEAFVTTTIDHRRVRAYFNSGLIAVRRGAGLFASWKDDFLRLMRGGHTDGPAGVAGMDEVSLAVTLGRVFERGRILDLRYNYPLQRVERPMLAAPWNEIQLDDIVHAHYRFWLHLPGFLRQVQPPFDSGSEALGWLEPQLPLWPVIDEAGIAAIRSASGKSIHDFPRGMP